MATMTKKQSDAFNAFQVLFHRAHLAGMAAGSAVGVAPMMVREHSNPLTYSPVGAATVVMDGVCGFATITLRPATSAAAKFAKAHCGWRTDSYTGGMVKSVAFFNQSMTRKEAYAKAFAAVLTEAGLTAYADSRMD